MIRRVGFFFTVSLMFMVTMLMVFSAFYHYVEKLDWLDSFYFTVITTRTIGFGDISPQTVAGKIGTIVNAVLPATVFLGTSLVVLETGMRYLENYWKRLRMKSNRNHDLIVADAEMLESIVTEYTLKNRKFVVVSNVEGGRLPAGLDRYLNEGNLLYGDATQDRILETAQIGHAKSIVIATGDDNFNMYVLVTAKALNPGIKAVVQVNRRETESKFRSVGADILLPAATVLGRMLSEAAVSTISHNFLVALHTSTRDPFFQEISVRESDAGRKAREVFPSAITIFRDNNYIFDLERNVLCEDDVVLSLKLEYEG